MKALVFSIVLLGGLGIGVGLYRGWFSLTSHSDAGVANVNVSVDKDKIQADAGTVVDQMHNAGHKAADKASASTRPASD